MPIKHIAIRPSNGHANDPTRPGCAFAVGIGGNIEVLTLGKTDRVRVSCDGLELPGNPARWPSDKPAGKHTVLIEQIDSTAVVDKKEGTIEIVAAEPAAPPADTTPSEANAEV